MPDRKRKRKKTRPGKWLLERVVVPFLLKILESLVSILSPAAIKRLAFWIGDLLYRLPFFNPQVAKTQWMEVMGEKDEKVVNHKIRQVFRHFALSFMEVILLKKKGARVLEDLVEEVKGEKFLKEALAQGRGVILLTAHLGNWEILGAWLGNRDYPTATLVRSPSVPAVRQLMEELRSVMKLETVERTNLLPVRSILQEGKILGVLADQYVPGGVVCDFLGRETPSPATPAVFHLRLGSPIIPAFIVRQGEEMKHQITFLPPLDWSLATSSRENIARGTTICNQILGEFILRYPEQWNWLHRRWRD
ncbi:MAG: hypothetical protein PWP04_1516 [Candidatus Atribacteria bacterium]|nr:hypothetical protein [Candidatus Atribacteria bacterium]